MIGLVECSSYTPIHTQLVTKQDQVDQHKIIKCVTLEGVFESTINSITKIANFLCKKNNNLGRKHSQIKQHMAYNHVMLQGFLNQCFNILLNFCLMVTIHEGGKRWV